MVTPHIAGVDYRKARIQPIFAVARLSRLCRSRAPYRAFLPPCQLSPFHRAMQSAKWPDLQLLEGVVREFVLNDAHLALWLKGAQGDGFLAWERIWTVPPDDVRV